MGSARPVSVGAELSAVEALSPWRRGHGATVAVSIGVIIGALAGFFGGWVDTALSRMTARVQVLPALLFAMVLVTLFTPSLTVVILAIGSVAWTGTARLARAEFMRLRHLLAHRVTPLPPAHSRPGRRPRRASDRRWSRTLRNRGAAPQPGAGCRAF